ncbi:hypothetical protein HDU97_004713 [Phlyctochytrium planicorne]|nr:hypothetical protein HDU97_004713 [Phlyctochytrium planicorne]
MYPGDAQSAGPSDITSISVSKGIYYISDSNSKLWMSSDKGSSWTSIDGTGSYISAFGSDMIAVSGTIAKQLYYRTLPNAWILAAGSSPPIVKVAGNSQGALWFLTTDMKLYQLTPNGIVPATVTEGDIRDFAVGERVWYLASDRLNVCSRDTQGFYNGICYRSAPEAVAIAASSTVVFIMGADGTLWSSTYKPLSDIAPFSAYPFTFTGVISDKVRALTVPLDEPYPILINAKGEIEVITCNDTEKGLRCVSSKQKPPAQTSQQTSTQSTSTTLPATTSQQNTNTQAPTSSSLPPQSPEQPAVAPQNQGAPSPAQADPSSTLKKNAVTITSVPQPSPQPPKDPNDPFQPQSESRDSTSSNSNSTLPILTSLFGGLILIVVMVMSGAILQRTIRAESRLDEMMVHVKEAKSKVKSRRQRQAIEALQQNETGQVQPPQAVLPSTSSTHQPLRHGGGDALTNRNSSPPNYNT